MAKFADKTASIGQPRQRAARLPSLAGAARTYANQENCPTARRPRAKGRTAAPVCAGFYHPKANQTTFNAAECRRNAGIAKSP